MDSNGRGPTHEQQLASSIAKTIFRINGQLVEMAEHMARPVGLTAAWWRVLGGIIDGPLPVSEIGRRFGVTRQSVQPVADLLVERGLAEYRANPAHRRAKLVAITDVGRDAVRRIGPAHRAWSEHLLAELGNDVLERTLEDLERLADAIATSVADPVT